MVPAHKRVAIIATDYFEYVELVKPKQALEAKGLQVDVLTPSGKGIQGLNHVDLAETVSADGAIKEADADEYDALIVPGGAVNADHLRVNKDAQQFITEFDNASKPVAVICHGPWLLISAGLAKDRKLTSYYTIQDDLKNAGAGWVDEPVVVDENLITSRKPDDIPAFNQAILEALAISDE